MSILKIMSQQSPLSERSYFKKYRKPILALIAMIFLVIVLVIPIIPIQKTVTKTRTRNLLYNDKFIRGDNYGDSYVSITNKDSIGGIFSVTMNHYLIYPPDGTKKLEDTFSQSLFINAGATQIFHFPNWNWYIIGDAFDYSISAPSTQESYQETQTEYKSILSLILES